MESFFAEYSVSISIIAAFLCGSYFGSLVERMLRKWNNRSMPPVIGEAYKKEKERLEQHEKERKEKEESYRKPRSRTSARVRKKTKKTPKR